MANSTESQPMDLFDVEETYGPDDDQTFVKSLALQTSLNCSDSIQCGQNTFHSQVSNTQGSCYSLSEVQDVSVDDMCFDKMDIDLRDLPKQLYISKLIEITSSSEEMISRYRTSLSKRVQESADHPLGMLMVRKNTTKSSCVEKYALDCFKLHMFLNGDTSSIDDVFKATPSRQKDTPNRPRFLPGTPSHDAPWRAEVNTLKAEMATMKTDIALLRNSMMDKNTTLKSISDTVRKDIKLIQDAILDCASELNKITFAESVQPNKANSLAQQLKSMSSSISKLESHRLQMVEKLNVIETRSQDNARNIQCLTDKRFAELSGIKHQLKDLDSKVTSAESQSEKAMTSSREQENSLKSVRKLASAASDKKNDSSLSRIEDGFTKMSKDLSTKLDNLCGTLGEFIHAYTRSPDSLMNVQSANAQRNGEPSAHTEPTRPQTGNQARPNVERLETTHTDGVEVSPAKSISVIFERDACGATNGPSLVNNNRFKGVLRRETKRYFLGGIDLDSDEYGLKDFLESNDVTCSNVILFQSRRNSTLSAQITIWRDQAHLVETPGFWPDGIVCNEWKTNRGRRQRTRRDREEDN